jgi:hypothetical protein
MKPFLLLLYSSPYSVTVHFKDSVGLSLDRTSYHCYQTDCSSRSLKEARFDSKKQVRVMVGKFSDCSSGHRIKALQRILRSSSNGKTTALLIVPGLDGRNNKESMTLLKFIFFGSVAMDLFQNSLVDDALEEMVLLIQENSVWIVYSSAAKKLCDKELSSCQNLIEYVSSDEEQDEVIELTPLANISYNCIVEVMKSDCKYDGSDLKPG